MDQYIQTQILIQGILEQSISAHFLDTGEIATAVSGIKYRFFPDAVVYIQGSIVIDIDGATFDSNYILPPNLDSQEKKFAETIWFSYWRGYLTINRLNAINLHGVDLEFIRTIIGEEKYSYIIEASYSDRDTTTGTPYIPVSSPYYYVNFGVFHPIIKFYDNGDDDEGIKTNLFDNVTISNLYVSNVTFYNPISYYAFFTSLVDEFQEVYITDFVFENIECYAWLYPLLLINLEGNFYAQNGVFRNISSSTVDSDVVTFAPDKGIIQIQSMNEYDVSNQSIRAFQNVTFDKVYGDYANVFYFDIEVSEESALQNIIVFINSSTFQNCYSNEHGTIYFMDSPGIDFYILNSTFSNNYGLSGPADLYIESSESLTIESTTFEGFSISDSKGISVIIASL